MLYLSHPSHAKLWILHLSSLTLAELDPATERLIVHSDREPPDAAVEEMTNYLRHQAGLTAPYMIRRPASDGDLPARLILTSASGPASILFFATSPLFAAGITMGPRDTTIIGPIVDPLSLDTIVPALNSDPIEPGHLLHAAAAGILETEALGGIPPELRDPIHLARLWHGRPIIPARSSTPASSTDP